MNLKGVNNLDTDKMKSVTNLRFTLISQYYHIIGALNSIKIRLLRVGFCL